MNIEMHSNGHMVRSRYKDGQSALCWLTTGTEVNTKVDSSILQGQPMNTQLVILSRGLNRI